MRWDGPTPVQPGPASGWATFKGSTGPSSVSQNRFHVNLQVVKQTGTGMASCALAVPSSMPTGF